jgi:penicillin amidase
MRKLSFVVSLLITVALVVALHRSWNFGTSIPPLGKFLDPFHGFWQNAESPTMKSRTLAIPGLKEPVTVVYDSLHIPHLFANNDEDLYFAQGYVTAADRLWQMEFQTHAGAGRISEIIGKAALDYDRDQRRMGMLFAAQNSEAAMNADPTAKAMVDSYSNGINAYIQTLTYGELPIEYKLLDYRPEPWTNLKVALLLANMAKTLNVGEKDLEMTNALKLFGKETCDLLFPDNENVGDPIVDSPGGWKFKPVTLDGTPLALPDELVNVKPVGEKTSKDVGSNNWAVSGSKTATGSPMLCNDPHLTLSLPSIWYVIHLHAPGVNVMGASLPGAPAVVSGFNDSIAWGETNAQRDLVDWYKIKFKDNSRNEYLSDGQWKHSRKVIEKIVIKGGAPFYDTVVYTHQGPVRYDASFHGDNEKNQFAYRWVSHDPSTEFLTFQKLNRGKNHADYLEALDHYSAPAQNFVFASVSGDIAMRVQGKYPVRRPGEGKYILDGTKTSTEWKAFIPNDQNVMYKNPERGFVSSANQYPVDATYPYYINGSSFEAYRNRRINAVLSELKNITPQDLMNLQLDVYNLQAAESLPTFLDYLDTGTLSREELEAYRKLKAWDYRNTVSSDTAPFYEAWWRALYPMVWDEMFDSKVELDAPTRYTTIKLLKEKPDLSFFDIVGTPEKETAREVVRKSFSAAVAKVATWKHEHPGMPLRWADYKDTFVGHLLRGLPAFSYHVEHGGGADIVDASTHTHGPSWRMVVSLEKSGVKAWGVYPGGESGNPGSPYYNNLLDAWAKGHYYALHFSHSPDALRNFSLATVTLNTSSR